MKRTVLTISALICCNAFAFVSGMLVRPEYGDPSLMPLQDVSFGEDAWIQPVAFVPYDGITEITAIRWYKTIPRRECVPEMVFPLVLGFCSYEAARATTEGGAGLSNLIDSQYLINPLPLSASGRWEASVLPATYDLPPSLTNSIWQYGCYTVNYTSDCGFDLIVGGAAKYCCASNNAVFNIMATSSSRKVVISARSPDASICFGIAENPIHQFVQSDWSCYAAGSDLPKTNKGGVVSHEWRMVAFRAKIENQRVVCGMVGFNEDEKLDQPSQVTTNEMWKPRTSFQKDSRVGFQCGMFSGFVSNTNSTDKTAIKGYGFKLYGRWLDDSTLERIRDLDRAEMTRRGYGK